MSNEVIFGEVRSLLAQHQDPEQIDWSQWDALNKLLAQVDEPYLDEVLVPYCLDHMAHWPDKVCRIHGAWWCAFDEGRKAAALRLVRYYCRHEMSADDIEALVAHPSLVNLRVFDITDNEWTIGARGGHALANAPSMSNLRRLLLYNSAASTGTAIAIARSAYLTLLEELDLGDCYIQDEGLKALAQSENMASIKKLRLSACHLTGVGVDALAKSPHIHQLQRLGLGGNRIAGYSIARLVQTPWAKQLQSLSLWYNKGSGDAGAIAIGEAAFPELEYLALYLNGLGPEGGYAILHSFGLPQLARLDLSANAIGDGALEGLHDSSLPALRELNLNNTNLTVDGLNHLLSWTGIANLKRLNLSDNPLGLLGARMLVACEDIGGIESLYVRENDVTAEGYAMLQDVFGDRL